MIRKHDKVDSYSKYLVNLALYRKHCVASIGSMEVSEIAWTFHGA